MCEKRENLLRFWSKLGKSIKTIAQDLCLSRNTVRKALRDPEPPQYQRQKKQQGGFGTFSPLPAATGSRSASVRAIVEHPFQSIKNVFGYDKVRYRGLAKNESHLYTLFASANLLVTGRKLASAPI